jgi:ATP-dependent RNA helicase DDX31/DBP7
MLHLGHLAKAFALKETPTVISRQQNKRRAKAAPAMAAKRRKPSHLHQLAAYGGAGAGGKPRKAGARNEDAAWQRKQERVRAASEFSAAMPPR